MAPKMLRWKYGEGRGARSAFGAMAAWWATGDILYFGQPPAAQIGDVMVDGRNVGV
jgi:hypothetical protein